jgi:glutamate-5-semialdehyde dehydrogenase
MLEIGNDAKVAAYELASLTTSEKNKVLITLADKLDTSIDRLLVANKKDIEQYNGNPALIDRLTLTREGIKAISESVRDIAKLPDPIDEVIEQFTRPNGLQISKVRVPIGVIGIIYESRPNVTIDAAAMCIKTGNAVILRGGSDAIQTNIALVEVIQQSLSYCGVTTDAVQLITDTTRDSATEFMKLQALDVLIPRGGAGLINAVKQNATVPIIETGVGNCHIFVDETADFKMATEIVVNAKASRPSVCNSAEKLLVNESIADEFLPIVTKALVAAGVEIVESPTEDDWYEEYLDYKIAIKTVANVDEAIQHINKYSTHHSEAIVTENNDNATKFLKCVDSAAVYVNASTRFTDGGEFGFGAEIGISTQKLHARGPMGLRELTSNKYTIVGNGQVR